MLLSYELRRNTHSSILEFNIQNNPLQYKRFLARLSVVIAVCHVQLFNVLAAMQVMQLPTSLIRLNALPKHNCGYAICGTSQDKLVQSDHF